MPPWGQRPAEPGPDPRHHPVDHRRPPDPGHNAWAEGSGHRCTHAADHVNARCDDSWHAGPDRHDRPDSAPRPDAHGHGPRPDADADSLTPAAGIPTLTWG